MGEAKRRKQLDPYFGSMPRTSNRLTTIQELEGELQQLGMPVPSLGEDFTCFLSEEAVQTTNILINHHGKSPYEAVELCSQFVPIFNHKFLETLEKSQGLFLLWASMSNFANEIETRTISRAEAKELWDNHWSMAQPILGRVNLADPLVHSWLRRLKGITLFVVEKLAHSLSLKDSLTLFSHEEKQPIMAMGETTIEIGLAFGNNNVIYAGKSLMIYKGKDVGDSIEHRGELMIAVKHASGCWNHYPSAENEKIPLSDYKRSKAELKKISIFLRGELIHARSAKLAKLLGLTIKGRHAYLTGC
ncbi:hypothetical protein QUB05_05645 [Microcoleus sp. F10-C6]|uniref:hypothetical protein n=1 Tax=unclassified Microcoleus TaxID=2642155 RepID=UPI002FD4027F